MPRPRSLLIGLALIVVLGVPAFLGIKHFMGPRDVNVANGITTFKISVPGSFSIKTPENEIVTCTFQGMDDWEQDCSSPQSEEKGWNWMFWPLSFGKETQSRGYQVAVGIKPDEDSFPQTKYHLFDIQEIPWFSAQVTTTMTLAR